MVMPINVNHIIAGNRFNRTLIPQRAPKVRNYYGPYGDLFSRLGVDPDYDRFSKILKGKAREELKKFISPEKMNIIKGGKVVQLPKHIINIPHFTRGSPDEGGLGSGDGNPGDTIGQIGKNGRPGPGKPGDGDEPGPGAGEDPGDHMEEEWGPEITRSEIARMIMEDLSLPNLEPKGNRSVTETNIKWNVIGRKGTKIHIKSTLKNAIKSAAIEQGENVTPESVVPFDEDIRYHDWQIIEKPHANAVIIYMMDVSGSMGEPEKQKARTLSFYLSTIIQHQFGEYNARLRDEAFTDDKFGEGVEEVFIIHDAQAREVPEREFYTTRESGGTMISSAYKKAEEVIKARYDPNLWNIYIFHYSDGDNWGNDNSEVLDAMDRLLPHVNEIGFVQIKSSWGFSWGTQFKDVVDEKYGQKHLKVRSTGIEEDEPEEYKKVILDMLGSRSNE